MRKMGSYQKGVEAKVRKNLPDGEFTIRELAGKTRSRRLNVSNATHKLEKEGVVVRSGMVKTGGRGRPAVVYVRSE